MKERSKIDLKLWKRNKIYNIFSQYDDPYTGLISKIDVTNIITFLNDNDYSFYGTMVYLCLCVFNEIEEFKKLILSLGKSEVESQERLIDLTVENLKKLTVESKEDIKNKGNLYKKLITFSGICIGIILI